MTPAQFEAVVARARLAPSVHNTQPARWRRVGQDIEIWADWSVWLQAADGEGRDLALSCGAAAEATRLALSDMGIAAEITDLWQGLQVPGPVARLRVTGACAPDPLAKWLEKRHTARSGFRPDSQDWTARDAVLVWDRAEKDALGAWHDQASARVLADHAQRQELRRWMRLAPWHPRRGHDGMARAQLAMSWPVAAAANLALGPLWGVIARLGLTQAIGSEQQKGRQAAVIALFHRPQGESPLQSGIAYLRLWLAATQRGWAGWPMAALTDDPATAALVAEHFPLPTGERLLQALRFGPPRQPMTPHIRLPLADLILR